MRRRLRIVRVIVDIVGEVRPMAQSEEKSRLGLSKKENGHLTESCRDVDQLSKGAWHSTIGFFPAMSG